MNEKLATITEQCSQLFMRFGVRSLTMDDVAKHLRISKKTLYQFVSDKSDLVLKCIQSSCMLDQAKIEAIIEKEVNAIDELFEISYLVSAKLNQVHPSVFYDIEKYHPEAMQAFESHKNTFIAGTIEANLQKGIKEGLYRADLNIPIIARIYLNSIDQTLHGNLFPDETYNLAQTYIELFRYHVRGVASEKGLAYLVKKVNAEQLVNPKP